MRIAWRWAAVAAVLCVACGGSGGKGGGNSPAASPTATPTDAPTPSPSATPGAGPTPTPTATTNGLPSPQPTTAACAPRTCATAAKNCGAIDDGCGGTLYCGTCAEGQVCGAAGSANVCGAPAASCTPTTCQALGASCGRVPNGCGATLDCGGCSGAQTCGGGGTPNACGSPPVTGGETRWVAYVGGPDGDSVDALRSDADGNLYLLGQTIGEHPALFVQRRTSDGGLAWEKRFPVPARSFVWLWGFDVSPGGDVVVAIGMSCGAGDACGIDLGGGSLGGGVAKLGSDGSFKWQRPGTGSAIAAGPHGEVATARWEASGTTVEVLDASGASRWSTQLNNAHALAFAPDGALLVSWNDAQDSWAPKLSKLDAAGATAWARTTQGYVQRLAVSGRGTVVAAESNQLAVYEAGDGAQRFRVSIPLWAADLAVRPGIHDVVEAVAVGQDQAGCGQMEARAYDLAGAFRWVRLVGPSAGCGGSPMASAVTILDSGDVVVGGTQPTNADFGKGEHVPAGASDGFLVDLAP